MYDEIIYLFIIILARRQNSLYTPNHYTLKWYIIMLRIVQIMASLIRFSKTMQPTVINLPSNNLPHDAESFKCGDSENSFSFESSVWAYLIIAYCFCSHGKGDFRLATVVLVRVLGAINATPKQTISGEEMHTLITFMVSVMASNIVDGL